MCYCLTFAAAAGLDDDERRVFVHRHDAASADPVSDGAGRAAVGANARGAAAGAHARHQGAQVAGPGAAGPLPHGESGAAGALPYGT